MMVMAVSDILMEPKKRLSSFCHESSFAGSVAGSKNAQDPV